MTYNEMLNKLLCVFNSVFIDANIDENTTTDNIDNWDSLKQIELMFACEEEFGVKFTMKEIITAVSVKEIMRLLWGKLERL